MGKLLGPIVWKCKKDNLPPLTSLVVRQEDHSVGDGYDEDFRADGVEVPLDGDPKARQIVLDEYAT